MRCEHGTKPKYDCSICRNAYSNVYYKRHRDYYRDYSRIYYQKYKDKYKAYRDAKRQKQKATETVVFARIWRQVKKEGKS